MNTHYLLVCKKGSMRYPATMTTEYGFHHRLLSALAPSLTATTRCQSLSFSWSAQQHKKFPPYMHTYLYVRTSHYLASRFTQVLVCRHRYQRVVFLRDVLGPHMGRQGQPTGKRSDSAAAVLQTMRRRRVRTADRRSSAYGWLVWWWCCSG